MKETLGVDIGGVIIDKVNDGTDTSFFGDNYLRTTAVPQAFETIARLVAQKFGENAHIVSKCGINVERKTRHWLEHHGFYEKTGIARNRIHFCRTRQEKAPICAKLGITQFVDDKLEVLGYLESVPTKYLFQPNRSEMQRFSQHLSKVATVWSWQEILERELK